MSLPAAGRFAICAATALVALMLHAEADAQSLFNTRGAAGQSQAAAASGSLFSRIGFPQPASASGVSGAGGSFVGRSNRGFVGGRGTSQSSSSGSENSNANRSPSGSRGAVEGAVERASASSSGERQLDSPAGGARRTRIVPRHRIAFEFAAKDAADINSQLTKQLANLAVRNPGFAQIEVLTQPDGLVKLQGQVPSDETRKLAAIIVGLEPGVRSVQNELIVDGDRE